MAETEDDLKRLDSLFDDARQARPAMPEALTARILADAASCQADHRATLQAQANGTPPDRLADVAFGLWQQFRRAVGGWPAMGGMVAATAAGLWIGLAPPSFLPDPVALVQGTSESTNLPYENYDLAMLLDEETQ
ncbi:hypothetical protein PXK00_11870 [Phaeobacter sp. QD34_3]|uniref:hypothetical protein n=1 Tax=unclassified Phaeobacter TaxID=2621772 RepID=UPI00237F64E1|nr:MULTISPECIES: hypothetical protein [unclassified Phaeobacter]MDE4133811.1 hypothetical protein [Phaeobacter sp. QD34_3]MDE4137497.1 hypothetical protein [Phaeobacter sp. QD34_24]MDE4174961.1 hypothetical protein [Phaeobacter sp. PT47_59]